MKRKYILVFVATIGIHTWVYVVPLSADECPFDRVRAHKQELIGSLIKELRLTREQQNMIRQRRNALDKQQEGIKKQIREKRSILRGELEKEESDDEKISSVTDDLVDLIDQRITNRTECILDIKGILTSKQFKLFQERTRALQKKCKLNKRFKVND